VCGAKRVSGRLPGRAPAQDECVARGVLTDLVGPTGQWLVLVALTGVLVVADWAELDVCQGFGEVPTGSDNENTICWPSQATARLNCSSPASEYGPA
jgi:hypothetical protein